MLKRFDDVLEMSKEAATLLAAIEAFNDEDRRARCLFCGANINRGSLSDSHSPDCLSLRIAPWLDKWEKASGS